MHRVHNRHPTLEKHKDYRREPQLQLPLPTSDRGPRAQRRLNGEENLDAKVLAVLHELAVEHDLVGADAIALRVGGVGRFGNLDFAPLPVGGDLYWSARAVKSGCEGQLTGTPRSMMRLNSLYTPCSSMQPSL